MAARVIVLTLTLCFFGAACATETTRAQMGSWKLNEAKSKLAAGMPKNSTVVYEAAGDNVKVTVEGVDSEGKPTRNEWTGKFDGKDYPVTGDPNSDARAYTKVNDHTLTFTAKKGGKVTVTGRIVVSADGKSRTVTVRGTDAKGRKIKSTAVYEAVKWYAHCDKDSWTGPTREWRSEAQRDADAHNGKNSGHGASVLPTR